MGSPIQLLKGDKGKYMPIEGFDYKEFAKNLSEQAAQVIPPDVSKQDREFVVHIVHKFCLLSGEALANDQAITLDSVQASLVTQFIGEWSFHKSVDLARAGIEIAHREGILEKIAYTVFEVAKNAVVNRMPQEQIIPLVEHHVNARFKEAIVDLQNKGVLDEGASNSALNQSNVDDMAKTQAEAEVPGAAMSDTKILKLASLALLIKGFPVERAKSILAKFNKPEAEVLLQYLKMPDLETKIDTGITARCLEEIKHHIPQPTKITFDRCYAKLCKIVKFSDEKNIANIVKKERPTVKAFALSPFTQQEAALPARVAAVVCKYLEEKVVAK
ncbi:hypothetical protein tpqmel_0195 [Candidatus Gastranaerophilus sp. (ex Termes propinquus)]|nr:hypothetical protein tpqmel_0195 [Candidatus Gastranaerophilus sp. (ex Termes propinquus)]